MNLSNSSNSGIVSGASWQPVPVIMIIIIIVATALNAIVLYAFRIERCLHSPFDWLLGNLLITNIIQILLIKPVEVALIVYSPENLGRNLCSYFLFSRKIVHGALYYSHMLVSLNRIGAVCWPISYREKFNRRCADWYFNVAVYYCDFDPRFFAE